VCAGFPFRGTVQNTHAFGHPLSVNIFTSSLGGGQIPWIWI